MALMDEFKEERQAVLHGPLRKKLSYLWHYYKWPVIIIIMIVTFTTNYIYTLVTRPEPLLHGIVLNTNNDDAYTDGEKLISDFAQKYAINTSDYSLVLETNLYYQTTEVSAAAASNYEAMQVMLTRSSTGELDFITGDLDSLVALGYNEFFSDLSEILSPEQYALYEPYMFYIDKVIIGELNEVAWGEDTSDISIPNPRKPETMKEPIPILIDMTQREKLNSIYNLTFDTLVLGVVNIEEPETTVKFIDYLMQK